MLGHLGRLDRHPFHPRGEGGQERGQRRAVALVAQAHHHALGAPEGLEGLTQPQVLGRDREAQAAAGPVALEGAREAHGQLGREQHQRPGAQRVLQQLELRAHEGHVGPVLLVHGGVEGHPQQLGPGQRGRGLLHGGEPQPSGPQPGLQQLVEAGLEQRRAALAQPLQHRPLAVEAGHVVAGLGQAGGGHAAQVPQAVDDDPHVRLSSTQGLARSQSRVRSTPWRMVSLGRQPRARARAASRKMKGLSPIQPRSPPV